MIDLAGERISSGESVLVVAPTAEDAQVACTLLRENQIPAETHAGGHDLARRLADRVSVLLVAQEALDSATFQSIDFALRNQPDWSDLPLIVLTISTARDPATSAAVLDLLPAGNVTLLERPLRQVTLLSAVRVALRARDRQHRVRLLYERGIAVKNTIAEGLYTLDAQGRVVYANPAAQRLLGWSAAELAGRNMHDTIHYKHPDGRAFPASECAGLSVLRDETVLRDYEDVFIRKDGRFFPVVYSAAPLMENGIAVGVVVSFRDDSERREREAERAHLLESERAARSQAEHANRLKDEFLATLSHELRTPLNAILGWAQLLERAPSDPETVSRGIEVIGQSARMQSQLISDLLDMSRIISGKMRLDVKRVSLVAVLDAAIDSVRPAADANAIRIEKFTAPEADYVNGDPARLQQVLWNILSNAVKFSPRGGRIQIRLAISGSHVQIRVDDQGKGISRDFLPYIFERFRQADASATRQYGGLGLGLAIVKQLVELHGGSVEASSPGEGKGTSFVVRLPAAPQQSQAASNESPGYLDLVSEMSPSELAGIRVLILDDDAGARELTARILESSSANVIAAANADDALHALQHEAIDVIVSDISMPGQDGYTFIRRAREAGFHQPAAALTAFARSDDRVHALRAGYQAHLTKPIGAPELIASVAALALPVRREIESAN
jgi:PAS domain S-box-containing protein